MLIVLSLTQVGFSADETWDSAIDTWGPSEWQMAYEPQVEYHGCLLFMSLIILRFSFTHR